MKLVLEKPWMKQWMLFANELANDKGFVPHKECFFELPNSERWLANRIIREKAKEVDVYVFNQCAWEGGTGWEFWTSDESKVLSVAEKVAEILGLELEIGEICN